MSQALPIGNGRMGAMIFGGVPSERVQFNEQSLWSGRHRDDSRPDAPAGLQAVRSLIEAGNQWKEAEELANETLAVDMRAFGAYQAFGDLFLDFDSSHDVVEDYRRSLDLKRAVGTVHYRAGGVTYTREYFASFPDRVIVIRLTSDKPGKLNFRCGCRASIKPQGSRPRTIPSPCGGKSSKANSCAITSWTIVRCLTG